MTELIQYIEALPLQDKINIVTYDFSALWPTLQKKDPASNGRNLALTIIASAVSADGKLTTGEVALIKAVFNVIGIKTPATDKEILDFIVKFAGIDSFNTVKALGDTMTEEERERLVSAVIIISAADGEVSEHEAGFICSLIPGADNK